MLSELIRLLEEDSGNWSLQELSRSLGVHTNVVSGMLELLIERGRVLEMEPLCGVCETCSLNGLCSSSVHQLKLYRLMNRNHQNPDKRFLKAS